MRTSIEWVINPDGTNGFTFNPITGCLRGCDYCYARKIAMRFQGNFEPKFHHERLNDPLKIKKPSTIFVGSMSDVFGDWVPWEWIQQILKVVELCPQHTFIFLTKNPLRYNTFTFPNILFLPNALLGNTVTDGYARYAKHFISAEPLLGEIILSVPNLEWIIIGALNNGRNPVTPEKGGTKKEWVLNLIEQADNLEIPVFIKDSLYKLYPDLPQRRELPYLKYENPCAFNQFKKNNACSLSREPKERHSQFKKFEKNILKGG